jgi:demethylmenaquinone methyltransferase/2-methoxy-6-polyprenyl-1,4-benzoquinol methylase
VDDRPAQPAEVRRLVESQRRFYDLRAPDYAEETRPPDRKVPGLADPATIRCLVDELDPQGDVLELACGAGAFTAELVRHAASLTAVDGSERMLERNRVAVSDPDVEYVCADLFAWMPTRRYDVVFFGFWLSHVPPPLFDAFWEMVRACLRPGGRAAFVDEDERARPYEAAAAPHLPRHVRARRPRHRRIGAWGSTLVHRLTAGRSRRLDIHFV